MLSKIFSNANFLLVRTCKIYQYLDGRPSVNKPTEIAGHVLLHLASDYMIQHGIADADDHISPRMLQLFGEHLRRDRLQLEALGRKRDLKQDK